MMESLLVVKKVIPKVILPSKLADQQHLVKRHHLLLFLSLAWVLLHLVSALLCLVQVR